MLASKKLVQACNAQIGNELAASNQYVAIAGHFDVAGLAGLARFFYRQGEEERDHAMKFVHFILDAGGGLEIPEIPAPRPRFDTAEEAIQLALDSEERVTRQIYDLVELARKEANYIAIRFLDWFVDEQFEEVTSMTELLQVVQRAGEDRLLAVEEFLQREGKLPPPEAGESE
jgi:bacterioferritin B